MAAAVWAADHAGAAITEPAQPPALPAGTAGDAETSQAPAADESAVVPRFYIREYRVVGAKRLPRIEVEDAVYPFLGPGRTNADLAAAANALQKAYHEKGFSTVRVAPGQSSRGIVVLEVVEAPISRLRVKGSRYFLPRR